jgi:hypothetical protein
MTSDRLSDRVDLPGTNHLITGTDPQIKRDDSSVHTPVAARITPGKARQILDSLVPTDRSVVAVLSEVRMASGRQLNRLLWPMTASGARQARRHLARLVDLRVLTRLDRQVGGIKGGSQGYTYALDVVGQRIAQTEHTRAIRRPTPSDFFVDHTLAVTDIYIALQEAQASGRLEVLVYRSEPGCWRSFTGPAGRTMRLKPDAYAAWARDEWELSAFFEADQATEHPGRIKRKAQQYVDYWRTGTEQRTAGGVFPSVIWVTPYARRATVLRQTLSEFDEQAQRLFTVITTDQLTDFINTTPREEVNP